MSGRVHAVPASEMRRHRFRPRAAIPSVKGAIACLRAIWRRNTKYIVPIAVTFSYLTFTIAVHLRLLDALDVAVRHAANAGGGWGSTQMRAARAAHTFAPVHLWVPLLLVVVVLTLARRSLRPLLVLAAVGVPVAVVTLGTKWVMARWDTRMWPISHGSFPSGHTVSAIVVFGLVVMVFGPRTRWGWILPALSGFAMGSVLIVADIHPATDVIGGALLGAVALTTAQVSGLGQWAQRSRDMR